MSKEVDIDDLETLEDLQSLDSLIGDMQYDSFLTDDVNKNGRMNENAVDFSFHEKIVTDEVHPIQNKLQEISPDIVITSIDINNVRSVVGTKSGRVYYFDEDYNYLSFFELNEKCGATVVSLSNDNKRVLVGMANGSVFMFDTANPAKYIRKLPSNCHAVELSPVRFLQFLSSHAIALCADSSSIMKCDFTRILGKRGTDVSQIHRGELVQPPSVIDYTVFDRLSNQPLYDVTICGYVTPQKLFIIPIKGDKNEFSLVFPHNAAKGALISLSLAVSSSHELKAFLAHGSSITCFSFQENKNWIVEKLLNIDESCSYIALFPRTSLILAALSPDCTCPYKLATIDTISGMIVDLQTENDFDTVVVLPVKTSPGEIVYLTANSQSGKRMLKKKKIPTWRERIKKLQSDGNLLDAIKLAVRLFKDEKTSLIDADEDIGEFSINVQRYIAVLLYEYMTKTLCEFGNMQNGTASNLMAQSAEFVISVLLISNQVELLWRGNDDFKSSVMESYVAASDDGKQVFFLNLSHHIQTNELQNISPSLLTPFMNYLYDKGDFKSFILYMKYINLASLDINLTLKLFWSINFFKGVIIVYNYALKDVCSPVEALIKYMDDVKEQTQVYQEAGNTLLVYLYSSLVGLNYPDGGISDDAESGRELIYILLTTKYSIDNYPILRKLLIYNTQSVIDLLKLAVNKLSEEQVFNMINILLELSKALNNESQGLLLLFVGYQIAHHEYLEIGKSEAGYLLKYLVKNRSSLKDEAENVSSALFKSGKLNGINKDELKELVKKAGFYSIYSGLALADKEYSEALSAVYNRDENNLERTIQFIRFVISNFDHADTYIFKEDVLKKYINPILNINRKNGVTLLLDCLMNNLKEVLNQRDDNFNILEEIFDSSRCDVLDTDLCKEYVKQVILHKPNEIVEVLLRVSIDMEDIQAIIFESNIPTATAFFYEKTGDFKRASTILFSQLENADHNNCQLNELNNFINFANRQSINLDQDERNELFLPLFDLFKKLPMNELKNVLPKALAGLIGKVPMVKAVDAFITFFNSSGCEGITFGEMKSFLHEMLDSTLQELSNVKELYNISRQDKTENLAKLRKGRARAVLGGFEDYCGISGAAFNNQSVVIFNDQNSEYFLEALSKDPDQDPITNLLAQKHRRQFQEEGKQYIFLEPDSSPKSINSNIISQHLMESL